MGFLKTEVKDKEGKAVYEKNADGTDKLDANGNKIPKTINGYQSIGSDFKNIDTNLAQIADNIVNNNIVAQSIKTALNKDNNLNFFNAVGQYVRDENKTKTMLTNEDLKKAINGLTNTDPEGLKGALRDVVKNYNEKGNALGKVEFSIADGIGVKDITMVNLSNIDITNPNEIAGFLAGLTAYNEINAGSRNSMVSAIMDMLNYGNINTNAMTTQEWLNKKGSDGITYSNSLFDKTWDTYTNRRISTLDHRLQNPVADFINDVQDVIGIKLRVTDAYRSIEEQNALYAIGRDENGKVIDKTVTNAKGGESYHNYGLGIDVVAIGGKKRDIDYSIVPSNDSLVSIGKDYGFEWGGDWTGNKKDNPHFQMPFGQSWQYYYNSDLIKKEINNK
jgi:hypothetical protein